jgi:hypothetical protein
MKFQKKLKSLDPIPPSPPYGQDGFCLCPQALSTSANSATVLGSIPTSNDAVGSGIVRKSEGEGAMKYRSSVACCKSREDFPNLTKKKIKGNTTYYMYTGILS